MDSKQFIFIGGTGRSGTGILSEILGSSSKIYRMPFELRLQVDPDGLMDLKYALTKNWDIYHANVALNRFIMFYDKLATFSYNSYHRFSFDRLTNEKVIREALVDFLKNLGVEKEKRLWTGNSPLLPKLINKTSLSKEFRSKFYPDFYFSAGLQEKEFNEAARLLYSELFKEVFKDHDYVADHTPYNFLYFKELNEIYSDAKFIHTYRNPLDIATSYNKMKWGSSDLSRDVRTIISLYKKWFSLKNELINFIEIPMEGFIKHPEKQIETVCNYLDISQNSINLDSFSKDKANVDRWKGKKDALENLPYLNEMFEIASDLGYKV
jgi:hypothetical protein